MFDEPASGADAVLAGWGRREDNSLPDVLHEVTVPIVNDAGN